MTGAAVAKGDLPYVLGAILPLLAAGAVLRSAAHLLGAARGR